MPLGHCVPVSSTNVEVPLQEQRRGGVDTPPVSKGTGGGLAPARGILVGLASSLLFWAAVLAALCL